MIKHKKTVLFSLIIITIILAWGLNNSHTIRKITGDSQLRQEASLEQSSKKPGNPGQQQSEIQSGAVTTLPWEEERTFLEAQTRYSTSLLLAAYRTVLMDPLPGEEENVHLAANYLAGTIIEAGHVFSQNDTIGPYSEDRGFKNGPTYIGNQMTTTTGGGVCKIASTLYMWRYYQIYRFERMRTVCRSLCSLPADATSSYGSKDFKFMNDTGHTILIWAKAINNVLYIGFYGQVKPPRVEWEHKYEKSYQSYTIYHHNPNYNQGVEIVASEGMDGGLVRSWAKIYKDDGSCILKPLGLSYYSPLPRIVEKGSSANPNSQ